MKIGNRNPDITSTTSTIEVNERVGLTGNSFRASRGDQSAASTHESAQLIGALLITSVCVHLLLVGLLGFGIRPDPLRPLRIDPPATVIEDVKLEPAPPEPKEEKPNPVAEQPPEAGSHGPAAISALDLPPLPELTEINAVAATVPVAFALPVTGVVRQVKHGGQASGAVGGGSPNLSPISANVGSEHARFLLLPRLEYPPAAKARHISGTVVIDFKTTPTGEIHDLHVRTSSGYAELDEAALQNLRRGRWTGEAGFFVKNFIFVLK